METNDRALKDGQPAEAGRSLTRRQVLRSMAASAGALAVLPALSPADWAEALAIRRQAASAASTGTLPHFFNDQQRQAVDILTDLIIPTDAHSPGARQAGVTEFIDYTLTGASEATQQIWRDGLAALDAKSRQSSSKPFAELTPAQQVAMLEEISGGEGKPETPLEKLFVEAKEQTVLGFYTSEIGIHQELGYKGNQFLDEFVGCTHPEHQA
jgi:hypothetical protein